MPARGAGAARYGLCGDPPHTPDCDARDGEGTGRATGTRVERGENLHRSVLVSKSHGDTNTGIVPITRRVCGSVINLQLVRGSLAGANRYGKAVIALYQLPYGKA